MSSQSRIIKTIPASVPAAPAPVPESERVVIAAMFQDPDKVIPSVARSLGEDAFRNPANKELAKLLIARHQEDQPVDIMAVTQYLAHNKRLDALGGPFALTETATLPATGLMFRHHLRIVKNAALRYRLWATGFTMMQEASIADPESPSDDMLAEGEKKLMDLRSTFENKQDSLVPIRQVLKRVIEEAEEQFRNQGKMRGIPTGLSEIDAVTYGFQDSDLIILAARPSVGKSALALTMAHHASKEGFPTAFFGLEMSNEQNGQRICAASASINLSRFLDGAFAKQDFTRMVPVLHGAKNLPLYLKQATNMTIWDIRSDIRRAVRQQGIKLVFIDYLQLIKPSKGRGNREQEVAEMTNILKATAMELNIPIVALSQLSREAAKSDRPKLHHLRESGSLEQDANCVMLLHRELKGNQGRHSRDDDDDDDENEQDDSIAELEIAKQRNGVQGVIVKLEYLGKYTRFQDAH